MAVIFPIVSTFDPKGVNQAQKSIGGLGKQANLLKAAFTGVGIAAVAKGLQSSVLAASSLSESIAKSNTVFGKNAQAIQAWSETTAKALGVSQQAALEAAGTYGNLFRAFGINEQESAKMSQSLVTLAADLASFNNVPIEDALLALRSGLSGETEPLKRFGIALNEARLKEQALAMGLITTTKGTLPQAIKTQAAYALILKDSALAQGDVARTSDGLANQLKFLKAGLEDAKAGFGEALLPAALSVVTAFNEKLLPAIDRVVEGFKFQGAEGGLRTLYTQIATLTGNMTGLSKLIKDVILLLIGMKIAIIALRVGPPIIAALTSALTAMRIAALYGAAGVKVLGTAIKTQLISTGIGALVVGLGFVISKFIDAKIAASNLDQEITVLESNGATSFQRFGNNIENRVTKKLNAASLAAQRLAENAENAGIMDVKRGRTGFFGSTGGGDTGGGGGGGTASGLTKAEKAAKKAAEAAEKAAKAMAKIVAAANAISTKALDKMNKVLTTAREKLQDAKDAFAEYKDSVKEAIISQFSFTSALSVFTDTQKNAKDAAKNLAEAQLKYNEALKDPKDVQKVSDALKDLTAAQKENADATKNQKTFMQSLKEQAATAIGFANKVKTLIKMGLSQSGIDQVIAAGAEAGTAIADELIAGGATAINDAKDLLASVEDAAKSLAQSGADKFYKSGVTQGQAMVDGIISSITKAGFIIQGGMAALPKPLQTALKKGTLTSAQGSELMGIIGNSQSVTAPSSKSGSGATINLTVNAGMGANGTQVGREIVDAIKKYERTSGPVFLSA